MATAVIWMSVLLLGFLGLRTVWPYAGRWALIATPFMGYGLWMLWRWLPANHRPGEAALLPTLGWGNGLTLMRGLAVALVAGFLFSPWPQGALGWLPVLLYTAADIADFLDGYLARITDHATDLGARLDMEFDGLGMAVVSLLAVWYGQLPWWYLFLGAARYLFVLGLWWRERCELPVYEMPTSVHRRIFAGFQMGFMSAVLWPILPPAGATIAGTIFAAATAVSFLRDWLVTVGWLDPVAPGYRRVQTAAVRIAREWLPLLLRLTLALALGRILVGLAALPAPPDWQALLQGWSVSGGLAPVLAVIVGLIAIGAGITAVLGAAVRLSSLLLLFPIGFEIASGGVNGWNGMALTAVTCLMLLGPGLWALWPVEEPYMVRRAGE